MTKGKIYEALKKIIEDRTGEELKTSDCLRLTDVSKELSENFNEMMDNEADSFIEIYLKKEK
jgi:hypothetical protein